ncbi:uncharacterized protein LOC134871677 isoform X2 [Eleginops maclovinus]|uniref:uncharacterized protein LOC134871677 isoform X2 n=1 Tax=Eleginops maclovinus TaxID=56733 RepID=UPI00308026F1
MRRYVKSSLRQGRDPVSEGPAEAESDSGDSLFITQKPVPEAVRSGRSTRYSWWAKPLSPTDIEESEEDKESSDSYHGESPSGNLHRIKKIRLPKFSFPFRAERKRVLLRVHNERLHSYLMGGFFECVRLRDLRMGCQTTKDVESSLPTVDMDGEHISPLSEEDEERLDEEDIKVVERKQFLMSSKSSRKKKISAAEDVRQENVNGSVETAVRVEDYLASGSCNMEYNGEDVEQFGTFTEPPDANVETRKKKNKKWGGREVIVTTEECEEEEAPNRTLDLLQISPEKLEGLEICSKNAAETQEKFKSRYVKKKEHKKKQASPSKDATQEVDTRYSHERNEKVDNTQKTKEGLEDQNADLTERKKKKKKILNSNLFEDHVPQSDDSVSMKEKEEKGTSSFLVADAEDNDAPVEQNDSDVRKKKKKRKIPVAQDSVEINIEQSFEEPNKWVKRKKKETGNKTDSVTPTERLKSAGDGEFSPTDEAVVSKKKRKKKKRCKADPCNVIQEDPSATEDVESLKSSLNDCSSVSHKNIGKNAPSAETFHSKIEMSPSYSIVDSKSKKVRRRLHNPSKDFFKPTD